MATILLTGANGKVSAATIAALKGSGHTLIGLVRDPSKAQHLGIELRTGDLDRPRTLEGAFDGVDTAWLLAPPGALAPAQSSNALWAARQAKVQHTTSPRTRATGPRSPPTLWRRSRVDSPTRSPSSRGSTPARSGSVRAPSL